MQERKARVKVEPLARLAAGLRETGAPLGSFSVSATIQ